MISGESGLDAHLDPDAVRRERDLTGLVIRQCVDVGLRRRDVILVRHHCLTRSMIVPVDSAPPAHMVISAVLWSVRSSSCSAVVISRLPVLPTG